MMPKTRTIADLTAADIRQVLTDIFQPVRIANIQYHRREACWSATLTTEWAGEEDGKTTTTHMRDEVKMYDPWQYETRSIDPDGIPPGRKDLLLWKQFCFSRGTIGMITHT